MSKFASSLRQPNDIDLQHPLFRRREGPYINMEAPPAAESHRYFAFQPILTLRKRVIGYEALFRAGWEDVFSGHSNTATLIMIDNWLLYGFEDLTGNSPTFLNCTREALVSGLLTMLPRWAVFEILETVEPDEEVLKACRNLKALGYRISLDDFESPDKMDGFLELADFIKIDFRLSNFQERARLVKLLKGTGATLIAEKIETEDEFRMAAWEGFELFQGYYFRERASFAMSKDVLNAENCMRILETLKEPGFAIGKLAEYTDLEPGLSCRLLRRVNWITAPHSPVNSIRDALRLIGKAEFRQLVRLALLAGVQDWNNLPPEYAWAGGSTEGLEAGEPTTLPTTGDSSGPPQKKGETALGKILRMSTPRTTPRPKR